MEEMAGKEKKQRCRKSWELSRDFMSYEYIIIFLLVKLLFYPSSLSNLQIKSLTSNLINYILVPMIFSSQNTSHKNSISPLTQNYRFALQNRQISIFHIFLKLGMLQSTLLTKISSSKFTYPLYWNDGGYWAYISSFLSYVSSS